MEGELERGHNDSIEQKSFTRWALIIFDNSQAKMISIVKPLYCFIVSELRLEGRVNALEEIRFSIGEKLLSCHLVEVLIAWRFSQKKKNWSQICGMSFGEQQRRHLLRVLFASVKYYSEWLLVGKVVCNSGSSTSFIQTRTIHSCYELDRAHFNHFMVFPFIFYFLFIPSPEH